MMPKILPRSTIVSAVVAFILIGDPGASPLRAQRIDLLTPLDAPVACQLTTEATEDAGLVLTLGRGGAARMRPARGLERQFWILSPAGPGVFRLQRFEAGQLWSLTTNGLGGQITLEPSAHVVRQLWRLTPSLAVATAARMESLAFPHHYLAGHKDSHVALEPTSGAAALNWFLDVSPPPEPIQLPTLRMAEQRVRPAPELPPVETTLVNSRRNELWVLVTDLRDGTAQHVRIPAGGSVDVALERDPGATIVESYRVTSPLGNVYQEQFITSIPPLPLYDVTVYERFLQSIAIDRTGKSPNRIEDVNYQPKSVGIFPIPAGPQFGGGRLDVYRLAQQADNAGGVRPLRAADWEPEREKAEELDPVERALREAGQ